MLFAHHALDLRDNVGIPVRHVSRLGRVGAEVVELNAHGGLRAARLPN